MDWDPARRPVPPCNARARDQRPAGPSLPRSKASSTLLDKSVKVIWHFAGTAASMARLIGSGRYLLIVEREDVT